MASPKTPWGDITEEEYYARQGITGTKFRFESPRGISLFARTWAPLKGSPSAIICMIHGYGNDISWTFQNNAIFFAQMGCAAAAIDLPGHGQSDGLKGFVPNVDHVVNDCIAYFDSIYRDTNVPKFLFGESMGAAICLLIHLAQPQANWSGAILVAPMCKISDNVRPSWPVATFLTFLASLMPTLPIVPTEDLVEKAVKVPDKRILGRGNPHSVDGAGSFYEAVESTIWMQHVHPSRDSPSGEVVLDHHPHRTFIILDVAALKFIEEILVVDG
ncbi:caffeoylshikimate esterase isoform X2 [Cryptomeria japonica]|uniref:caffeoylshikimate esterase isoform X2 n=1 Tax=Cryptomeria japonica TaxID=3369 RepID=UPI0025ABFADA|nr:caffeoylshikimate esterase isoform X2 [Cryptomeria japonica]